MSNKKVLIYGGRGGLGNVLVSHFKSHGWWVLSVDLAANDAADANVTVDPNADWVKQVHLVLLLYNFHSNYRYWLNYCHTSAYKETKVIDHFLIQNQEM